MTGVETLTFAMAFNGGFAENWAAFEKLLIFCILLLILIKSVALYT
jgi:hypothetical protein